MPLCQFLPEHIIVAGLRRTLMNALNLVHPDKYKCSGMSINQTTVGEVWIIRSVYNQTLIDHQCIDEQLKFCYKS